MNRTDRQLHLALGTLLNRVRVSNSWSSQSFTKEAKYVNNITSAEALRFYKALVDNNYLLPGTNKRKLAPHFNTNIWRNEDAKISLVIEVLNLIPDFVKSKGRKSNNQYKSDKLKSLSASVLVQELRNRGYNVKVTRTITKVEEL